jgi:opacity protein-like surface antigen
MMRISLVTGASFASVLGLASSGAWAQYYIGAQAGWTGLPYQTDTIEGVGPIPVQFNAGYNVGARGGYRLTPWRFEEEYSYRRNGVAEYNESTNGVSGNRHTNSIMGNVLYDFSTGWPIMPHIGVGIGAMNVFDGLKIPSRGLVFNDSSWQFAYQAIAGLRYDINPVLTLDLDYRYLATTESTFGMPNTTLHYRTGVNTNNFVASLTYRFGLLPTDAPSTPEPTTPPRVGGGRALREFLFGRSRHDSGHETRRILCLLMVPSGSTPCPACGDPVRGGAGLRVPIRLGIAV